MLPGYEAELRRLQQPQAGPRPPVRLRIGDPLRVVVPGDRYDGVVGVLVKRGRTRYHLRVEGRVLTVPFAMVEPV
jgi:hypothetical protein